MADMLSRLVILLILLNSSYVLAKTCEHTEKKFSCVEFIKNYDGDTITIKIPKAPAFFAKPMKVRVRGIDTAEMKGKSPCEKKLAKKAKTYVYELLKKAKVIDLVNVDQDKYFRLLADVHFDGKNLATLLLQNNLAIPYEGKKKQKVDWCRF